MSARRGAERGGRVRIDVGRAGTRAGLAPDAVRRVAAFVLRAEGVRRADLSVALVSDAVMAGVNATYLGRRRPTDVIAFSLPSPDGRLMGDVYVAPGVARRSAARHGVTVREENVRLIVHGVLHVLGHDHPDGEGRTGSPMWRRQEELVAGAMRRLRW
ncbi:MAG: rRNA maturation RNase YbeY [Gemmatimonadota bacterium]|nr:rRNA maturation RNase YbeY [Gemmatimonadota bacterium]